MLFKAHINSYTMQTCLIYCRQDYKFRLDSLSKIKKSAEHEGLYKNQILFLQKNVYFNKKKPKQTFWRPPDFAGKSNCSNWMTFQVSVATRFCRVLIFASS